MRTRRSMSGVMFPPMGASRAAERQREALGASRAYRDLGGLSAEHPMPGLEGVGARRQTGDREAPILTGYGEKRMRQDVEVPVHPKMHVALERNADFLRLHLFRRLHTFHG